MSRGARGFSFVRRRGVPADVRGQLSAVVAPRTALNELQMQQKIK
jgi:hypothetical protein